MKTLSSPFLQLTSLFIFQCLCLCVWERDTEKLKFTLMSVRCTLFSLIYRCEPFLKRQWWEFWEFERLFRKERPLATSLPTRKGCEWRWRPALLGDDTTAAGGFFLTHRKDWHSADGRAAGYRGTDDIKPVQLWCLWLRYSRNFLAQLFNVFLCILNTKKLVGNSRLCQVSWTNHQHHRHPENSEEIGLPDSSWGSKPFFSGMNLCLSCHHILNDCYAFWHPTTAATIECKKGHHTSNLTAGFFLTIPAGSSKPNQCLSPRLFCWAETV